MEKFILFTKILAWVQLCLFTYHVYSVLKHNSEVRNSQISRLLGYREVSVSILGVWLSVISTAFLIAF